MAPAIAKTATIIGVDAQLIEVEAETGSPQLFKTPAGVFRYDG
jgi:hypothetical protein